jgi:2-oxoacid:acceptor oxidoreductase gamma subunit (pyruvate/2-ketoisovalerate family)
MIEIRIWGRGGQGAVTTGQILAIAALHDGKYCQSFPHFGVERRGAPVEAYARIDKDPINVRAQVYNPDIVVVLDPSLIGAVDVVAGIKEGGIVIVNSHKKPKELKLKDGFKLYTVDATAAAMEIFKMPIVNTPILGAFSAITKQVSLRSLLKAVDEKFASTKGKQLAELNKKAIKHVFEQTKV